LRKPARKRALVAAALHQHVENFALVIDGAPQVHSLSGGVNYHLVKVPSVAGAWVKRRSLRANPGPNVKTHRRTVSYETARPRSAKSPSTSR
jgi:hypothetical protein